MVGDSVVESEAGRGVILGGNGRSGAAGGVREGRTILAVSRLAASEGDDALSGLGGSAIRTVSFFGSAMSSHVAP